MSNGTITLSNPIGKYDLDVTTFQMAVLFCWENRRYDSLTLENLRLGKPFFYTNQFHEFCFFMKSFHNFLFFREINFTNFCFFVKSFSRIFVFREINFTNFSLFFIATELPETELRKTLWSLVQFPKLKRQVLLYEPQVTKPSEFTEDTLFKINHEFAILKNGKLQKRGKINLIGRLQLSTEKARKEENESIMQLRILRTQEAIIKILKMRKVCMGFDVIYLMSRVFENRVFGYPKAKRNMR